MSGNRPANILFVHNNNDLYGAEVILLEILKHLDRSRFHPIVMLPEDTRHINRLSVELEKNGIEHGFLRMGILRRPYLTPFKVVQFVAELVCAVISLALLIRRRKMALVHTNTLAVTASAFAAFLTRTPHIWHVHEIVVDPVWLRKGMHWLAPRLANVVLCVSNPVRDHIAADQPSQAHKLRVIHNGIELDRFAEACGGGRIRKEFGIAADAPLIGMVGRVCRWKGQLIFAAAAHSVLERFPQARFLAVGGVFDKELHFMEQFRSEVDRLGIAHAFQISDFRRDIADVLNAYDIFVLPSTLPDPFPTVVLEAMAAGKPVIATAHGGTVEMVLNGETGYLVRPGDFEDLAVAICNLLHDPAAIKLMGYAGACRAFKEFPIRRFIIDMESLYTELCAAPNPPQCTKLKSKEGHVAR